MKYLAYTKRHLWSVLPVLIDCGQTGPRSEITRKTNHSENNRKGDGQIHRVVNVGSLLFHTEHIFTPLDRILKKGT